MKALVLAGGHGTRLRPITHTQSKQLVPVANKPVLFYGLEAIARAGIEEVVVIVGDAEDEIKAVTGDGQRWGLRISYVRQDAPRGLAHAVLAAENALRPGPFLMYLGDNLIKEDLRTFIRSFDQKGPEAQVFLVKVPDPEMFGVAEVQDDRVVRLVEKPASFVSDLALSGVYLFRDSIFEAAAAIAPSWRGELEITDALQHLVDGGSYVRAAVISGWWKDTGKLEDLLEANRFVLDDQERDVRGDVDENSQIIGAVRVEAGASISGSVIRGPVTIGKNCRIERSAIDPYTSINDGTVVVKSHLGNSIIMGDCYIDGSFAIRDSLIGRNVQIRRGDANAPSIQLMIGDNSSLAL